MSKHKNTKPERIIQPELEPVSCVAVTVYKHPDRVNISNSLELTIVNGVVISTRALNRAEDTNNMSVSKCSKRLWELIKMQTVDKVLGLKAGGATLVKKDS